MDMVLALIFGLWWTLLMLWIVVMGALRVSFHVAQWWESRHGRRTPARL